VPPFIQVSFNDECTNLPKNAAAFTKIMGALNQFLKHGPIYQRS
jgi:hypothetical protein